MQPAMQKDFVEAIRQMIGKSADLSALR
jgi:hypothetical protein